LTPGQLQPLRDVIKDYLSSNFGNDANAELDYKKLNKVLNDIVSALGGL
jgi:hypothetical protein